MLPGHASACAIVHAHARVWQPGEAGCYLDAQDAVTTGTRLPGVTVDDTQVGYAPKETSERQQHAEAGGISKP